MVNDYSILIDGYNLIFQCGLEGRSRTPASLQRARHRLIGELKVGLTDSIRKRTAIVFDATRLPSGESEPTQTDSGLTIIYAIDHEDADTLIELLIQKNSFIINFKSGRQIIFNFILIYWKIFFHISNANKKSIQVTYKYLIENKRCISSETIKIVFLYNKLSLYQYKLSHKSVKSSVDYNRVNYPPCEPSYIL